MKGLIIKDLSYVLKDIKLYAVMIILYTLIFSVSGFDAAQLSGVFIILSFIITINSFSFDDYNNWNKYALTMPIDRKDIVYSKYIYGILGVVVIMAALGFIDLIANLIKNKNVELDVLFSMLLISSFVIIAISIIYPILFKMGAERARIFMIIVLLLPTIIILGIAKLFPHVLTNLVNILENMNLTTIGIGYGIVVLLILLISIVTSIKIIEAKEF